MPNGITYESTPELLQKAPVIDSVYTEYQELNVGFYSNQSYLVFDPADCLIIIDGRGLIMLQR
ncbi:MAG: hypothetical protein U5K54_03275 [Cytophagales bacterium]|nr:hypothetical protein [Cytophagales bacterium]